MYVCWLITRKREGRLSPNFQGAPGMVLRAKIWGGGTVEARQLTDYQLITTYLRYNLVVIKIRPITVTLVFSDFSQCGRCMAWPNRRTKGSRTCI